MKHCILAILLLLPLAVDAQSDTAYARQSDYIPGKTSQFQPPVFQGFSVHYDLAAPLMGIAYGKVMNFEAQIDVNLYSRIYPVLEIGFASADETMAVGSVYTTRAPFFRVGLNYGLLKRFKDDGTVRSVRSYPFAGVRYAFAPMNYNIGNVVVSDTYWGSETVEEFGSPLVYSGWLEIVAGVRVDLYRGLTMGWSVRLKTLLHTTAHDKSYLWYVPGFGNAGGAAFGFNYTIGYTFYARNAGKQK
ncbi:MAG: DUF6048 family protein [Candidatus Aphodosoma sp.]